SQVKTPLVTWPLPVTLTLPPRDCNANDALTFWLSPEGTKLHTLGVETLPDGGRQVTPENSRKFLPTPGVAVSLTTTPSKKASLQSVGQRMPAGVETMRSPAPPSLTTLTTDRRR